MELCYRLLKPGWAHSARGRRIGSKTEPGSRRRCRALQEPGSPHTSSLTAERSEHAVAVFVRMHTR